MIFATIVFFASSIHSKGDAIGYNLNGNPGSDPDRLLQNTILSTDFSKRTLRGSNDSKLNLPVNL